MTDRLAAAIDAIRRLPADRQEHAAALLEAWLAQDGPPIEWTPEQLAEIRAGVAEADRGEFATDEDVAELFARFKK